MKILIGGAWPYTNYKLHLGHVAGLIGGDLLARYHREKGDDVIYVSGSDCHGTPITERAKKENTTPAEISERYHEGFKKAFEKLNFSYDLYTKTHTEYHAEKVKEIIKKIYENGAIYEKVEPQAFCEKCNKFMADRELQITCPNCGNLTKCDSCDCGYTPNEEDLLNATCLECGSKVVQKDNKNLYIALSKLQPQIEEFVNKNKSKWRANAQNETTKYLKEGLRDRAITRDLSWGIDVPVDGYDDKKLYVWIEAVLGYITAAMKVCEERGLNWEDYWKNPDKVYMVHGKDNIVFHSIIFPGLLLSMNDGMALPDTIVSSEYLNFNDEKISKSKGNAIPAEDLADKFNSDTIRFHLINNGPEKKDTSFNMLDYLTTHNNEIVNKYGNFVNRTLKFKGINKIPVATMDENIKKVIEETYEEVGKAIEKLEFKDASSKAMNLIEIANKYYDDEKPWIKYKENIEEFNNVIYTCANLIVNISNIMEPFMPSASEKIRKVFNIEKAKWEMMIIENEVELGEIEPLFVRYDEKDIKMEENKEEVKEPDDLITIDYLDKIKLKVAKVIEAEKVEGSEKLLKLKVSLGNEQRQIVAGLQKYYAPEELLNKKIVIVANLKPAKLKGIESQGMVLAAGDGDVVKALVVDDVVEDGADVH
ncbi:MAG: methionine--tRNA ligase [Clostridia bacterium]|nr:methionine--tRNA ligase [Clostridia bacterium]